MQFLLLLLAYEEVYINVKANKTGEIITAPHTLTSTFTLNYKVCFMLKAVSFIDENG